MDFNYGALKSLQLFQRLFDQREQIVVTIQSTTVASVRKVMIATVLSSHRIDEDGGTVQRKEVVVAVGGIRARLHLRDIVVLLIDFHHIIVKIRRVLTIGIDHGDSLVTAAEHVNVDHHLHLVKRHQRMFHEVFRTLQTTLLPAEKQEDSSVTGWLLGIITGKVHKGASS